jgi:apolipoprotein N-acyltransferase
MDYNRTAAVVAGIASAVAFHFGTRLEPLWLFAWLAPFPVLAVAYRVSARLALTLALGAWILGHLSFWMFLRGVLRVPVGVVAVLVVASAGAFAVTVLVSRALVRRAWFSAVLAVPALWVTFEFLMARVSPHGTAGNLAYTQMDFLPLVQTASITGLWGVSFLVMLGPAAVAVATSPDVGRGSGPRWAILGATAVIVTAAHGFGAVRLRERADVPGVRIGLAASDVAIRAFNTTDRGEALAVIGAFMPAIETLAARGAQVVVLPEKLVGVTDAYARDVEERLAGAAARHRVIVVAGVNEIATPLKRNVALVFAADGSLVGRYRKRHHIPGIEADYAAGDTALVLPGSTPPWGVAICKDLDFPALSREYAARGAGLLLVPAWDFVADAWLHERMAAMRAVESGFALARSARQGLLSVRDSRGRLVAVTRSDAAPIALLVATVEVRHDATVYARAGDWFAWLCVIAAAVVLARLARGRTWTVTV